MKLTKQQRQQVFDMFGGHCAYCGCLLNIKRWHADHIEPVWREWWKKRSIDRYNVVDGKIVKTIEKQQVGMLRPENDTIENLFPACIPCNIDKMVLSLETWRESLEQRVEVCRRNHSAFRHAERFGRIHVITEPLVFYFEKCGKET